MGNTGYRRLPGLEHELTLIAKKNARHRQGCNTTGYGERLGEIIAVKRVLMSSMMAMSCDEAPAARIGFIVLRCYGALPS